MKFKNKEFAEVENVVFDFGNVLLDIDLNKTIDAFVKLGVNKIDPAKVHPHNSGAFLLLEKGQISTEQFCDAIREMSNNATQIDNQQILDAWNEMLLPYDYGRFEMVKMLIKSGFKVFLLSNTNKPHHDFFEAVFNAENPWGETFKDQFDDVFYSDEMGMRKPDVEIYEAVQSSLTLDPRKTIFIDDNAPNLDAPKALDWHVFHLAVPTKVDSLFEMNIFGLTF